MVRSCFGLLLLLSTTIACTAPAPASQQPLNLVLITIDALRADSLSYAGHALIKSPSIDQMAAEGTVFTQLISSFVGTSASMPSLFSGRYPSFIGVDEWREPEWHGFSHLMAPGEKEGVPAALRTLTEVLRDHGYATAGFNTNPYLARRTGFAQGFESYDGFWPQMVKQRAAPHHPLELLYPPADVVVDGALEWLTASPGQPFFLWMHLMDAHSPYLPPPPFDRLPERHYLDCSNLQLNEALYRQLLEQRGQGVPEQAYRFPERSTWPQRIEHAEALYDGEIRFLDRELGRLFAFLDAQQLRQQTIIVVTADHGEELYDHGFFGHHLESPAFDELLRIPLVIVLPEQLGPQVAQVDRLVRQVDIFPTLLDYLDLPDEGLPLDGTSLRPLLQGTTTGPGRLALVDAVDFSVLRGERWKYRRVKRSFNSFAAGESLFDIVADPREEHDLAASHGDELRQQRLEYAALMTRLRQRGHSPVTAGQPAVVLDPERQEQLRRLGYVE